MNCSSESEKQNNEYISTATANKMSTDMLTWDEVDEVAKASSLSSSKVSEWKLLIWICNKDKIIISVNHTSSIKCVLKYFHHEIKVWMLQGPLYHYSHSLNEQGSSSEPEVKMQWKLYEQYKTKWLNYSQLMLVPLHRSLDDSLSLNESCHSESEMKEMTKLMTGTEFITTS